MRTLLVALFHFLTLTGCGSPVLFFSQQIENANKISEPSHFVGTWSIRNASLGLVVPETQEIAKIKIAAVGDNKLAFDGPSHFSSGITDPLMTAYRVHWDDTNCSMLRDSSVACQVLVSYDARRFIATERIPSTYIFSGENLRWKAYLPFVLKRAGNGHLLIFQPRPDHFQTLIENEALTGTIFNPAIQPALGQLRMTHLYVDINGETTKKAISEALDQQRFDSSVIAQPIFLATNQINQQPISDLTKFEQESEVIRELSEEVSQAFAMTSYSDEDAFVKAESFSFLARKARALAERHPVYEIPLTYLSHLLFEQNELLRRDIRQNEGISSIELFDRLNDAVGGPPEAIFSDYGAWLKALSEAPLIRSEIQADDTTGVDWISRGSLDVQSRERHASALIFWIEQVFCTRLASSPKSSRDEDATRYYTSSC